MAGAIVRTSRELDPENGQLRHGVDWVLTPEQYAELRSGYRCPPVPAGCGAAQETAFPEKCIEPYCNFNLKRDLVPWLERAYAGEEDPWPEAELDDPMEQHEFYANKAGIVLPPGFRP